MHTPFIGLRLRSTKSIKFLNVLVVHVLLFYHLVKHLDIYNVSKKERKRRKLVI